MRIIMFDIDTLRNDHLGCCGYGRNTSPTIDEIASQGVVFTSYYCPNAPCLPSRASLLTGQYGIRTGVVGHGGTAADIRVYGKDRNFRTPYGEDGLFNQFRRAGLYTVSFSTFAERHSAFWFYSGFNEIHNQGEGGMESAEKVTPTVLDWIDNNTGRDDFFLHIHFWDPHTPYRAPEEFGNPFENEPLSDNWITNEIFAEHLSHVGPHGPCEISMFDDEKPACYPRHPGRLSTPADMKNFIDQYDCAVKYTDDNIAKIIDKLKQNGMYDDQTAVIITSDHGENMGELGIYGEHATADEPTCHIPMIIKWPGCLRGAKIDEFYDNTDLLPTVRELLDINRKYNGEYEYDGISYAGAMRGENAKGRESVVLTQCCHVCQRSARFGDYLYIRTYHGGGHLFEKEMLFDIKKDPHQIKDLAASHPDLCAQGAAVILDWVDKNMEKSMYQTDPLWTVMAEDGPYHAVDELPAYLKRIENSPRSSQAEKFRQMYKKDLSKK